MIEFISEYSWLLKIFILFSVGWFAGVVSLAIFTCTDDPRGRDENTHI
jgi:hypothetical protein